MGQLDHIILFIPYNHKLLKISNKANRTKIQKKKLTPLRSIFTAGSPSFAFRVTTLPFFYNLKINSQRCFYHSNHQKKTKTKKRYLVRGDFRTTIFYNLGNGTRDG